MRRTLHVSFSSPRSPQSSVFAAQVISQQQSTPVSKRYLQCAARCIGVRQHHTGSRRAAASSSSASNYQEHQCQGATHPQSAASSAGEGHRQSMVMEVASAPIPSKTPTMAQGSAAVQQCSDNTLAPAQLSAEAAGSSPAKRRRTQWDWECSACSNKFNEGSRLLDHMIKCCPDLLPGTQQQQQQHSNNGLQYWQQYALSGVTGHQNILAGSNSSNDTTGCPGETAAAVTDDSSDTALRQMLVSAAEQEQALRMRVLQLQFVADPGGGVPAVKTFNTAAAGDDKVTCCDSPEDDADFDDGIDSRQGAGGVVPQGTGAAGAEPHHHQQQQHSAGSVDIQQSQEPTNQRGRSVRQPLRPPRVIADILQLPEKRVLKLIQRAPRSIRLVADPGPLHVVYEDAAFLAVLKPPGLRSAPVHRFLGGSALNRMIAYLGYEPHLLHRLDMNTSGVLVAAKDRSTASLAHAQFREKTVSKAYLALALGVPQQQQFAVDGPIAAHPRVKVARRVAEGGLDAITHVKVLSSNPAAHLLDPAPVASAATGETDDSQDSRSSAAAEDVLQHSSNPQIVQWGQVADNSSVVVGACLVCCRPVTGRTHQIRVHMAHAGHALLGDDLYGLQGPWIGRQALHAWTLTLHHPGNDQPVTFRAPPPGDFAQAAEFLGLQLPTE